MQATSERITSLCSSLGLNTPNGYIPSDDCQINLDELAFSIWRDDEAQRNVSAQCYQLSVFKKDFIPLLLTEGPLSYYALKALTAITYPPSPNAEEYDKHMNILADYKDKISYCPEVIAKVLEYCASIIENPRAEAALLNKAELAMTFIRNIAVIPCQPDVHERIFKIFDEQDLFEVIDLLKITRFGERKVKFAKIIADIFYGCFVPYLPLKKKDSEKPSALTSFLEEQKNQTRASSARHGHWDSFVTVKGKGRGYTVPLSVALSNKSTIPAGKHLVSRARPVEKKLRSPPFSQKAEEEAAKMINSPNFNIVFDLAFPRSFSAYDKSYSVHDQLHLVEMTKFFYDFSMIYGQELKVVPLASSNIISYFISMFTFFTDAPTLTIENITSIQAMNILCRTVSSLCSFLVHVIESDEVKLIDQQSAKDVVSRYAAEFESFLINFLCTKNLSKKSIDVQKDNIIALENLYNLYLVAEKKKLVRYKLSRRDEDANDDDPQADRIEEDISAFNSDFIVNKLSRRQGVLKPFFVILASPDDLDEEIVEAMTAMLKRFASNQQGLAHLFNLPYFYTINRIWNEKILEKSHIACFKELDAVLQDIVKKFFDFALIDKTMYIQLISGCDIMDLYDVEFMRRSKENEIHKSLGISQELSQELDNAIQEINEENRRKENSDSDDLDTKGFDIPQMPTREELYLKTFLQRKQKQQKKRKPRTPKRVLPDSNSDNEYDFEKEKNQLIEQKETRTKVISDTDSDSENLTLEDLKKHAMNSKSQKNASSQNNNSDDESNFGEVVVPDENVKSDSDMDLEDD